MRGWDERFAGRDIGVAATTMHYVESGVGQPVVFIHGNPTSSYLWRHVLPPLVAENRRLVAVDLIGMGASGKPDIGYRLADHIAYVEAFLDALRLTDIVFVAHDWGVAICLDYLRRHADRVKAVAFMEGHLWPLTSWADFDLGGREIFQRFRTEGVGERLVLAENALIETLLPAATRHPLADVDLDAYRHPYPDAASRRPLLQWTREIPIAGQPADVAGILDAAWTHLTQSDIPKLLIHGRPGAIVTGDKVARCRDELPNLVVADVDESGHFLPEDQPVPTATALARWLGTLA